MIRHVWERASAALCAERVVIATDDNRVSDAALSFGARVIMTSSECVSGTDRVAQACSVLLDEGAELDVVVNVQCDEPFLEPEAVTQLLDLISSNAAGGKAPMASLARDLDEDELEDRSCVKVVCDLGGYAIYFSRAPIGVFREDKHRFLARAHIGIYAYTWPFLKKLSSLKPTPLELAERLEQLRALENRLPIAIGHTHWRAGGVDTPEDLGKARELCV